MENEIILAKRAIEAQAERERAMLTTRGRDEYKREILIIIGALEGLGYKLPDVDVDLMAKLWGYELKEYVIAFGMGAVKQAVMSFAANDTREYHQYPSVGQIIAEIKEHNQDPRAIIARKEYDEIVRRMEEEQEREFEASITPEIRAALDALYAATVGGAR